MKAIGDGILPSPRFLTTGPHTMTGRFDQLWDMAGARIRRRFGLPARKAAFRWMVKEMKLDVADDPEMPTAAETRVAGLRKVPQ